MLANSNKAAKFHFRRLTRFHARAALAGIFLVQTSMTATAAEQTPAKTVVPDLQAACRPELIQAAVSKLSPAVTIKELPKEEIPNGSMMPGGTSFVAAAKGLPAYCQVSGSFVTNPKTGKT